MQSTLIIVNYITVLSKGRLVAACALRVTENSWPYMVTGASHLTQSVTTILYLVGLICDKGLDCINGNDNAIAKDKYPPPNKHMQREGFLGFHLIWCLSLNPFL